MVNQVGHRLTAPVHLQIFTDTVKNYYRTINRITYHRQKRRHESGINFQMQEREIAYRNQDIDYQGDNRGNGKFELEADGDVDNHQDPGNYDSQDGLLDQFPTHGSTHVLHAVNLVFS